MAVTDVHLALGFRWIPKKVAKYVQLSAKFQQQCTWVVVTAWFMNTVPSGNAALQDTDLWIFKSFFLIKTHAEHKTVCAYITRM